MGFKLGGSTAESILSWANVRNFGAVGDGVNDDAPAIQLAIAAQAAAGGGIVYFPEGLYRVASTIRISDSRVCLVGETRAGDYDTTASGKGVTLRWGGANGGGPVVQVQPVTNGTILTSGRIENITINGSDGAGNIAATGLLLVNVFGWEFHSLEVRACSTVAIDLNSAAVSSGVKGCVRNVFDDILIRQDSGVPSGIGFRLDGIDTTGNADHNEFRACHVQYYNGVGYQLKNCDTNWFIGCTSHRLLNGTGIAVEYQGSNTNVNLVARNNSWFGFSQDFDTGTGHGGVIARGTTSYTFASHDNYMAAYTVGNSNPVPTVETGASLYYVTDTGRYSNGVSRRAAYLTATGFIALGLEPVSNAVPTSGTNFANAVFLYAGEVITNILVAVATAATGTAPTHIQVTLFDSGATPTALAVGGEDNANARWTSTGWKEVPLSAPYTILTDGIYYPAFLMVGTFGTTNLQLITGAANPGSNIGGLTNGKRRAPTLGTGLGALLIVGSTGSYNGATSTPVIGVN